MKISPELSEQIRQEYFRLRGLGFAKTAARYTVADKFSVGKTTVYDHISQEEVVELPSTKIKIGTPSTTIITSWDLRTSVNKDFIKTLKRMAKEYNAQLLLVPCQLADFKYIPEELKDDFTIVAGDIKFNDNLQFKYVESGALVQSPLSGHRNIYPHSTIVPGLVKELVTEPTQTSIKQLMSTGSVGSLSAKYEDYEEDDKKFDQKWQRITSKQYSRSTVIAQTFIQPSALIVDVLNKRTFLTRYVTSSEDGVVYDLGKKFTPEGKEKIKPTALLTGDWHAFNASEVATKATKDMIRVLDPEMVVLHDFFDGCSVNHHELGDAVKFDKAPTLEEEALVSNVLLDEVCRLSNKVVYLHSNHDDFLDKMLNKSELFWRINGNYAKLLELQHYRATTGNAPIVKLLDLDSRKNLEYTKDKIINGVFVTHGDAGINGARTGFLAQAKVYGKFSCGHFHSPGIYRDSVCVGTNSKLRMGYNVGASNWGHANAILHEDGNIQLLNILAETGDWVR
jgi:hypothetical protein